MNNCTTSPPGLFPVVLMVRQLNFKLDIDFHPPALIVDFKKIITTVVWSVININIKVYNNNNNILRVN